jgi:hypothetical protein
MSDFKVAVGTGSLGVDLYEDNVNMLIAWIRDQRYLRLAREYARDQSERGGRYDGNLIVDQEILMVAK